MQSSLAQLKTAPKIQKLVSMPAKGVNSLLKSLALVILFVMTTNVVFGAAKTWTGAASTSWGTASDWNPSGVPGTGDDVTIPSGPSNQPVTVILADGSRWTPQNFGGSVGGKYTLREGVKYSVNLITIRAIMELAPPRQVVEYAHRMGIKSELPPYESLALGTGEVTPLELTSAFAVFADEGVYVEPISILRIEDRNGNTVEQTNPDRREVLSKETAYIMTSMLEGAVNEGTGSHVRQFFHLPAAGKTGTTQEYADAWFVGFTPGLAAGIWVGFDDHRVHFTNTDGQGGRAAAPIFGRFMQGVYDDREIAMPLAYFERPEGVVTKTICALTKKIATPYCPETATEIFNDKFPWPSCDVHVGPESRRVRDKGALHF